MECEDQAADVERSSSPRFRASGGGQETLLETDQSNAALDDPERSGEFACTESRAAPGGPGSVLARGKLEPDVGTRGAYSRETSPDPRSGSSAASRLVGPGHASPVRPPEARNPGRRRSVHGPRPGPRIQSDPFVQKLLADSLDQGAAERRLFLLEILAQTTQRSFPKAWRKPLEDALGDAEARPPLQAVRTVSVLQLADLDERSGAGPERRESAALRLEAFEALVRRSPVCTEDARVSQPPGRGGRRSPAPPAAAEVLRASVLDDDELARVLAAIRGTASSRRLSSPALAKAGDASLGEAPRRSGPLGPSPPNSGRCLRSSRGRSRPDR